MTGEASGVTHLIPTVAPQWRRGRTRSIWWSQLVLGASVALIACIILAVAPYHYRAWALVLGTAGILLCTILTLAVPWARLPLSAVMAIPFADVVCIAAMASSTDLPLGYLWAFPVIWIATYGSVTLLTAVVVLIAADLALLVTAEPTPAEFVRLTAIIVTTTFIGITAHAASGRSRAFRALLRRQTARHRRTSLSVTHDERRIVELTNALDDGVARIAPNGRLDFVNDAYADMYGMDRADLDQPPRSIDYEASGSTPVPEPERPLHRAARGEVFTDETVWVYNPRGQWRALSLTSKKLSDAAETGDPSMFLIAHDITDVLAAQREREQLVAMATHEMRHPLTAIVGNAELALDFDQLTDVTRERLEVIHQSSERLSELVRDFLTGSTSPGPDTEATAAFDLRTVLAASVQSFAAAADAGEVMVHVEIDEPLTVVADAFRLRQVVDNLVSNAIKYTRERGQVFVVGRHLDQRVIVTVSDTGIGMAPDDLARIFDPYFRAEAATGFAPGSGLGMGIARDLLALQGGALTVESRVAAGTTVTIDLPAAAAGTRTASPPFGMRAEGR